MADERDPEPQEEAVTPWRSLRGAARDLSSLFGEQSVEPDPGSSALGSQKLPAGGGRPAHALDALTQRMAYIERELSQTASRVQGVDRHVAATFLAVQGILERLPEPSADESGDAPWPVELGPLAKRLEAIGREINSAISVVGDRVERMARRLASVEVALAATAERLALTGAPPRAVTLPEVRDGTELGGTQADAEAEPGTEVGEGAAAPEADTAQPTDPDEGALPDAEGEMPSAEEDPAPFWRPAGAS